MEKGLSNMGNSVLHAEHEVLGATFVEVGDESLVPESYFGEQPAAELLKGCALADLSGYTYRYLSGAAAAQLVSATSTTWVPLVGECAFSPMLTGDGSLASVPLVMRTGDDEFALVDPSPRGEVVEGWLGFVEGIEQNGVKPFGEVTDEPAQDMLTPLVLAGASARAVLSDYVASADELPQPGKVVSTKLDRIQVLVAGVPWGLAEDCFLVLAPTTTARVLWRSFLSFPVVAPMGQRGLHELLARLPFGRRVLETSRVELGAAEVSSWGLLRSEHSFIGARGLR